MKKILSLVFVLLILSSTVVLAAGNPENRLLPLLVDDADLLTQVEESELSRRLELLSDRAGCDIAVVTVQSLDGKNAQAYADDFYDNNGYGTGPNYDGILFLIAMDEREWVITTCGIVIRAIPNRAIDVIADDIVPYLSAGNYYYAFATYADTACDYIEYYITNGSVFGFNDYTDDYYDDDYYYEEDVELTLGEKAGVSAVVAAIIALIVMLVIKSGMTTIRKNNYAKFYIINNSLNLRVSRETFLYRNVTKIRRETESSNRGGTHRSSSGRSHGGRSGRF